MEAVLTRGAVATIAESKAWHSAPVVLQVVDTLRTSFPLLTLRREMPSRMIEGCALVLSDGVHTHKMDLITPLRNIVKDGRVRKGSVVRLLSYCTIFRPLIFKLEVLQAEVALIGSPVPYEPGWKDDEEPDAKCAAGDAAASGGSYSSGQGTSSSWSARRF